MPTNERRARRATRSPYHGTLKEKVSKHFKQERAALLPLPDSDFFLANQDDWNWIKSPTLVSRLFLPCRDNAGIAAMNLPLHDGSICANLIHWPARASMIARQPAECIGAFSIAGRNGAIVAAIALIATADRRKAQ